MVWYRVKLAVFAIGMALAALALGLDFASTMQHHYPEGTGIGWILFDCTGGFLFHCAFDAVRWSEDVRRRNTAKQDHQ